MPCEKGGKKRQTCNFRKTERKGNPELRTPQNTQKKTPTKKPKTTHNQKKSFARLRTKTGYLKKGRPKEKSVSGKKGK